jgi:hypothetical protein
MNTLERKIEYICYGFTSWLEFNYMVNSIKLPANTSVDFFNIRTEKPLILSSQLKTETLVTKFVNEDHLFTLNIIKLRGLNGYPEWK